MRVPRFRITVRGMMVVAGITAIIATGVERRERFRRTSLAHSRAGKELNVSDLEYYLMVTELTMGDATPSQWAQYQELRRRELPVVQFLSYHQQMANKYERAAGQPWLPVASDPPAPPRPSKKYVKMVIAAYK